MEHFPLFFLPGDTCKEWAEQQGGSEFESQPSLADSAWVLTFSESISSFALWSVKQNNALTFLAWSLAQLRPCQFPSLISSSVQIGEGIRAARGADS